MSDTAGGGRQKKAIEDLTQEEVDTLTSRLLDRPITDVAVWDALRKMPDIEAGAGEIPESATKGCQKCGEEITEGDELTLAFNHYYHERCTP